MLQASGAGLDDFGSEEEQCLRHYAGSIDPSELAATDIFAGSPAIRLGLAACAPVAFFALMGAIFGLELEELSNDEKSCLRDFARRIDPSELADNASANFEAVPLGLLACAPAAQINLNLASIAADWGGNFAGIEIDVLSDDEESCLRDFARSIDPNELAANAGSDAALSACAPVALFVLGITSLAAFMHVELSNENLSCVRDFARSIDPNELAANAESDDIPPDLVACIPVVAAILMLEEADVDFYELDDQERSCIEEWAKNIEPSELLAPEFDVTDSIMLACVPDYSGEDGGEYREAPSEEFADTGPDDHADKSLKMPPLLPSMRLLGARSRTFGT